MMLMMLGLLGWNASAQGRLIVVGLECGRARQLMLMMLGLLGWTA